LGVNKAISFLLLPALVLCAAKKTRNMDGLVNNEPGCLWKQNPAPVFFYVKLNISFFFDVFMLIFLLFLDILPVRKLRQKGINLLAGRALTYHLHPLTAKEQESSWQISQSLRYGHLPARFSEHDPQKYLKDYPPARCYLFYGGSAPLYIDDTTVLPIEHAFWLMIII